jgi:HlyD family secretion protein
VPAPTPELATEEVVASLGLPRSGRRRRWFFALGGLLLLGGVAAVLLRPRPSAWEYQTQEITRGELTVEITAIGTLEPLHSVEVGSEVSGTVAKVFVETNDTVVAGQVLAELDTELLRSELRRTTAASKAADASLVQVRVGAEAAQQELARTRKLHEAKVVSDSSLEQAVTSYKQAAAAVSVAEAQADQARAAMASSKTQLDRTVITAPISGVVLARNVDPGQSVVSSLQAAVLFEVAEGLDHMSVDVEIDEADIGQVKAGQVADFTVAAWPDRVFGAVVHKVELAPKANSQVVTYLACLHLDNPEGLLRPGMTATARVQTQTWTDALLVPNAALRWAPAEQADLPPPAPREGKLVQRVWRLGSLSTEPEPVELVTGASDGRVSLVLEGGLDEGGLDEGDAVVVEATRSGRGADEP